MQVGPKSSDRNPCKYTQKKEPHAHGGRDWRDVAMSQRMNVRGPRKLEKGGRTLEPPRKPGPADTWISDSWLHSGRESASRYSRPQVRSCVCQPRGNGDNPVLILEAAQTDHQSLVPGYPVLIC